MSLDDKITPEDNKKEKPKLFTKIDIIEFCIGLGGGTAVELIAAADKAADSRTALGVLYNGFLFGGTSYIVGRWMYKFPPEEALRRGAAFGTGCVVGQVLCGLVKYM